jgi:hypothetical protein
MYATASVLTFYLIWSRRPQQLNPECRFRWRYDRPASAGMPALRESYLLRERNIPQNLLLTVLSEICSRNAGSSFGFGDRFFHPDGKLSVKSGITELVHTLCGEGFLPKSAKICLDNSYTLVILFAPQLTIK